MRSISLLLIGSMLWTTSPQLAFAKGAASPSTVQDHFRFKDDVGGETDTTWLAAEDTNISIGTNTNFRLRFSFYEANKVNASVSPRLEYKLALAGACTDAVGWTTVTTSGLINAFALSASSNFAEPVATTQQLSSSEPGPPGFVAGQLLEATNPGSSVTINGDSSEFSWNLTATSNALNNTAYIFRITNNGTALNTYSVCPQVTTTLPTKTVSGTVYTDEGTTTIGANKTVSLSIDGATSHVSAETAAGGTYTITATGADTATSIFTLYLNDETEKAVTVTETNGNNLTSINLYQNRLIVQNNNGGSVTTTDLATADNNGDTDITGRFTVDGSNVLHVKTGTELFIPTGQTYVPDAAIRAGSGIDINGTLTLAGNPVTLSGSWQATGGTFTTSNNNIVFNDGAGNHDIISSSIAFDYLTIGRPSGSATYRLGDALNVDGNLILSGGTLDVTTGNYAINVAGNWENAGGTLTARNGTVTLDGGDQAVTGTTTFYNFVKTVSTAQTLTFAASAQQIVTNSLTLRGIASNLLSIRSSSNGVAALLRLQTGGSQTIDYLDVKDNDASGGEALKCFTATEGCIDSTGTTNWLFESAATFNHWARFWLPFFGW